MGSLKDLGNSSDDVRIGYHHLEYPKAESPGSSLHESKDEKGNKNPNNSKGDNHSSSVGYAIMAPANHQHPMVESSMLLELPSPRSAFTPRSSASASPRAPPTRRSKGTPEGRIGYRMWIWMEFFDGSSDDICKL